MLNDRLPRYIVQLVAPIASPTLPAAEAQASIMEGLAVLGQRGMRRLSTEQKTQLLRFSIVMFKSIPATTCKALALGQLDTRAGRRLELRYAASLSLPEFEAHAAAVRAAVEAELSEYPDLKSINKGQAKAAERAYNAAVDARAQRLPAGMLERLETLETADAAEVCRWVQLSLSASLDLAEPYRGWWLSRFFESMQ